MNNSHARLGLLCLIACLGVFAGCSRQDPGPQAAPKKAAPAAKQIVVIEGTAKNATAGAILETSDKVVSINGVQAWPADTVGKRLKLKGELRTIQHPAASLNPMGQAVQGMVGTQHVLYDYSKVEADPR